MLAGLIAAVGLIALAAVDRPPFRALSFTTGLLALTFVALPESETRFACLSLLLVVGMTYTSFRTRDSAVMDLRHCFALAIGAQILFRPEGLAAELGWRFVSLELVLLPVAVAVAGSILAERVGSGVWLGIAAGILLHRGFSPELTLTVLGACLVVAATHSARPFGTLLLGACGAAVLWLLTNPEGSSAAGALVLGTGCGFALAASTLPSRIRQIGWLTLLGFALAAVALRGAYLSDAFGRVVPVILILAPASLLPPAGHRRRALLAVGIALLGAMFFPTSIAAAGPLLVLGGILQNRSTVVRLQTVWTVALIAGGALVSALPWARTEPFEVILGFVRLAPDWVGAITIPALFWLANVIATTRLKTFNVEGLTWAMLAYFLIGASLPSYRTTLQDAIVLRAGDPAIDIPLDTTVSAYFVDSYLSNGWFLEPGTPVASLWFLVDGRPTEETILRAGFDTAEWARRRPELATALDSDFSPSSWLSWPAPDGPYLAERYRADRTLEQAQEATSIHFERSIELPAEVEVTVFQIGVQP